MGLFAKVILILVGLLCCLQVIEMARLRRDGSAANNGKSLDNLDVNALSNMIMNRLKENLKDGGDSVKNIVNTASNTLQQHGGGIRVTAH